MIEAAHQRARDMLPSAQALAAQQAAQPKPKAEPAKVESGAAATAAPTAATKTGLPSRFLPAAGDDLTAFMRALEMEEYVPNLQSQAIFSVGDLRECNLTEQDLKDEIGIDKLKHRRLLLKVLADGLSGPPA